MTLRFSLAEKNMQRPPFGPQQPFHKALLYVNCRVPRWNAAYGSRCVLNRRTHNEIIAWRKQGVDGTENASHTLYNPLSERKAERSVSK